MRNISVGISVLLATLAGFALLAAPASASGKKCKRLPVSVKLSSHDPTDLLEKSQAWLYVKPKAKVNGARIRVTRGGKVYARGRMSGRLASGRTSIIKLNKVRTIGAGKYRVDVTARKNGCRSARTKKSKWGFSRPSLPVRALPFSTRVGDNVGSVRFTLGPIRRTAVGKVRVTLINSRGATIAEQVISELGHNQVVAELPIGGTLTPGRYKVVLVGQEQKGGAWRRSQQSFRFVSGGGGAKPVETTGEQIQKVVINWSGGDFQGRQTGGFIAPGIGYGEIVCSPEQQWIRFYPSNGGREAAMMNWTYKNWGTFSEKALREAKYANGTGPDFREGLNKFGPPEKYSTGEFQGIISDRGPIEGPGGVTLAPPTTLDMSWEWNFNSKESSRCFVQATFRTETELDVEPLARSVQIVWRGEKNATGANTVSTAEFPGLGEVSAVCEAGSKGVRQISTGSPVGGRIITREGSEDFLVNQKTGPLVSRLPNNGMLLFQLDSGQRVLVSSRWKVNDPNPEKNWCVISAQIYKP